MTPELMMDNLGITVSEVVANPEGGAACGGELFYELRTLRDLISYRNTGLDYFEALALRLENLGITIEEFDLPKTMEEWLESMRAFHPDEGEIPLEVQFVSDTVCNGVDWREEFPVKWPAYLEQFAKDYHDISYVKNLMDEWVSEQELGDTVFSITAARNIKRVASYIASCNEFVFCPKSLRSIYPDIAYYPCYLIENGYSYDTDETIRQILTTIGFCGLHTLNEIVNKEPAS